MNNETTTAPALVKLTREQKMKAYAKDLRKAGLGTVAQIIALHKRFKSAERSEIIGLGYNKNTAHRQIHEYETAKG